MPNVSKKSMSPMIERNAILLNLWKRLVVLILIDFYLQWFRGNPAEKILNFDSCKSNFFY